MNREEAARALQILASSPAAGWIGNKITEGVLLQKCTRCEAEETIVLPQGGDVPAGFDEALFQWKRTFQIAHEGCLEASATPAEGPAEGPQASPDVTIKRVLNCARHGTRTWRGHIMCDACGLIYQTTAAGQPGHAPDVCRCGHPLLPPMEERVGDVLGLRTSGIAIDEEGRQYQTAAAQDWTARPICYLCHRYFTKHHGGRVPVETGRS